MASTLSFNSTPQIVNTPRYDVKCMYYHTKNGCKYGDQCWYKHIQYSQQSQYDLLINLTRQTNNILQNTLKILNIVTTSITTSLPTAQSQNNEPISNSNEMKIKLVSPEPEQKTQQPFILEVIDCTPTPPPTVEPTPTSIYFEDTNQTAFNIDGFDDKTRFVEWILTQEMFDDDIRIYDVNVLAEKITGVNLEDQDINTGFRSTLYVYDKLYANGIKYRKLLNPNELNII